MAESRAYNAASKLGEGSGVGPMPSPGTSAAFCQERVSGNYVSRVCGRKVKEDGLCGIHLAARKKRQANDAKRSEKERRGKALQDEAQVLGDLLGIKVKADYATFGDGYTGDFIVPGDWLRKQAKS